jgi:phosphate ABC transporter phosphate-binding protein
MRTRLLAVGLSLAMFSAAGGCRNGGSEPNHLRLNVGGSTFIYPLMSKWAGVYENEKGVQINYQSIGSGGGIQKMIAKEFDFGCSDAPLNEEQMQKAQKSGGPVVHVPLTMGAVAIIYNLEGIDQPLQLSGPVIADIYMRRITIWSDPRIVALNPKLEGKLPNKNIVVVHRSDGSGTTHIFADYLAKVSPEWKQEVGVSTSLGWKADTIGAKGNEGVGGQVRLNGGAIGYVELAYAIKDKIQYAALQNQASKYVLPTPEGVTAAARVALIEGQIPDDLRYSLTNVPGEESYPIAGTAWAVLYTNPSSERGKAIVDFLRWAGRADGGQKYSADLHYAPLPEELVARIEKVLASVTVK